MPQTFTGEEFAQALESSTLQDQVALTGMAKKADDPSVILFAPGASCAQWIPIPVTMIEKVDWLGKAHCHDHTHEHVRITLAHNTSPEATVLASLLAGFSEGDSRHQHVTTAPPILAHAGHSEGMPAARGRTGGHGRPGHPPGIIAGRPPVVLASVTLAEGHTLQFVEFKPGWTGTVEIGRAKVHLPVVGAEVRSLGCLDCYRHVAGISSKIPQALLDAQGRIPLRMSNPTIAPRDAGAGGTGEGFHVFDDSEQAWFRETFCNGAQFCIQGWDWAVGTTDHSVNNATGISFVGSEGTVNATLFGYYWECACTTPFCIGGPDCFWIQYWQGVVLPGHWVSLNASAHNQYLQWNLTGAGGNTQVSLAATY
jgi:hypothetical protein